ncbi:hypothetical protein GCM10027575_33930 [Phytohabitans suffuscus]
MVDSCTHSNRHVPRSVHNQPTPTPIKERPTARHHLPPTNAGANAAKTHKSAILPATFPQATTIRESATISWPIRTNQTPTLEDLRDHHGRFRGWGHCLSMLVVRVGDQPRTCG